MILVTQAATVGGNHLSNLIAFVSGKMAVDIDIGDWPGTLVRELNRYFITESALISVDYSALSNEWEYRPRIGVGSDREDFIDGIKQAARIGRLELFIFIVSRYRKGGVSFSPERPESRPDSIDWDHLEKFYRSHTRVLRDAMVEEIAPDSSWLPWLLRESSRQAILGDTEMMSTLIGRVADEQGFATVFSLLQPKHGEDRSALGNLASLHWDHARALIEANIGRKQSYESSDPIHQVVSLFCYAPIVQESRWACEQVLTHAHRSMFPDLVRECRQISIDDVRELLVRLQASEEKEAADFKPSVSSAFLALGKYADSALPSDLALASLWNDLEFADEAPASRQQHEIVARLRELPSQAWRHDALWDELGPEARAAWRDDLFELVAGNPELSRCLIWFACLWLDQIAFVEVEPVLAKLIADGDDLAFVRALAAREPRRVKLRALGLTKTTLGSPLWESAPFGAATELAAVGATTWIGDPSVERIILQRLMRAEEQFTAEYLDEWGADEEVLTARLLASTETAAREIMDQLRQLSQATRGRFPALSVNVRQPGKAEEGTVTKAGAPLAADILFLTRIMDKGKLLAERATLVQVKKRRAGASGARFGSTVAIDLQQCRDLLTQTEHAFYLVLTPPAPEARLWVAPARLVGNLAQMHESRSSISASQLRDSSSSFAAFFLRHLIGLWSGDEREDIVASAKGDARRGRVARHVVEVVVTRQQD